MVGAAGVLGAVAACGALRPVSPANHRPRVAGAAARQPRQPASAPLRLFALRPGPGVERWLAGGAADGYEVEVAAGQYLAATIEPRGIEVKVNLYGPGRRSPLQVGGLAGAPGKEPVRLVAEVTGRYRLEVAVPAGAAGGLYVAHLDALRRASAADAMRAEAARSLVEARGWERRGAGGWEAAAKYERAARLSLRLGDGALEAAALFRLGELHLHEHRAEEALEPLRRARALFQAIHAGTWAAVAEAEIGKCHADAGENDLALAAYEQALGYLQGRREGADLATLLRNLGALQAVRGEVGEALRTFRQSIGVWQRLGDGAEEARDLTFVGWLYRQVGDREQAVAALWRAFRLDRHSRSGHAPVQLSQIGDVYLEMGEPARARLFFERALQLEGAAGDLDARGSMWMGLGVVFGRLGHFDQALAAQRRAAQSFHAAGNWLSEINSWIGQGSVFRQMGQAERAGDCFGIAFAQARAAGYRAAEAEALLGAGLAHRDRGALDAALAAGQDAIRIVEELRAGAERADLQASLAAVTVSYYDFVIDTLMQIHALRPARGDDLQALRYSEQARARGLLDALAVRRERHGGTGAASARWPAERDQERERVRRQIAAEDQERYDLVAAGAPTGAMDRRLAESLEQAHQLDDAPRPRAAAGASRGEIQHGALDDHTVLLEYYIGAERSYLWAVDATSVASFELSGGARLAALLRSAYELLAAGEAAQDGGEKDGGREPVRRFGGGAGEGKSASLVELSEILLGQVAGRLGEKRLVIVANGPLQYLPFAVLPEPGHGGEPLMVRHEIAYEQSLAVLAALRARPSAAPPAAGLVALFADPIFSRRAASGMLSLLAPPPRGSRGGDLTALPSSRDEAAAITALAGSEHVLAALGFDANRERVMDPRLRGYPIVHFATHGLLRIDQPDLTALALSQFDRAGRRRDGFLRAREIAELDLPADLVVLSACRTALGKEMGNEGLIGLPQAFMTAGARRVLVSLWDVGDFTAAALMERFYRALLKDHLPPAAALRAAQIAMWQDPRWSAPTAWAAFVLQGDWR